MISTTSLTTIVNTLSNRWLIVTSDLSNLSSACLNDYGPPTIHKKIPRASMEVDLELDVRLFCVFRRS
jgi:hypothetical protein